MRGFWGVRAWGYIKADDHDVDWGWMNNGRAESATVLYWMDGPHSPEYPEESKLLAALRTIAQLRAHIAGLEGAQADLIEVTSRTMANLVIENAELRRGFQVTGDVEALMRLEEK